MQRNAAGMAAPRAFGLGTGETVTCSGICTYLNDVLSSVVSCKCHLQVKNGPIYPQQRKPPFSKLLRKKCLFLPTCLFLLVKAATLLKWLRSTHTLRLRGVSSCAVVSHLARACRTPSF